METLSANLGQTRRTSLHGRQYIVAPMTLIVPGVLNGSKGSLMYPPDEVSKDPTVWNGFPIVVYHPTKDGNHVSARDPEVYASQNVGTVFNATALGGKLTAEGWFDVEAVRRIDNRILASLEAGRPIELSTGLFTDNEPAPKGAAFNGRAYEWVARNYRPDHIAVLPDQVGACSIKDGCGVMVNEEHKGTVERFWAWLTGNHGEHDQASHGGGGGEGLKIGSKVTLLKGTSLGAGTAKEDYPGEVTGVDKSEDGREFYRVMFIDKKGKERITHKFKDDLKLNATLQPHSQVTGYFKKYGAGTGKGPAHEAAQAGAVMLTDGDRANGASAAEQAGNGVNPPSWVSDEGTWEKAKTAADTGGYDEDTYWAVVAHIYRNMGGQVGNANPEGCNQHSGPGCGEGDIASQIEASRLSAERRQKETHSLMDAANAQRTKANALSDSAETVQEHQAAKDALQQVATSYKNLLDRNEKEQAAEIAFSGPSALSGLYREAVSLAERKAGWHDNKVKSGAKRPDKAAEETKLKIKTETDRILAADRSKGVKSKYKGPAGRAFAEDEAKKRLKINQTQQGEPDMDRKATIAHLTANCDCWKGDEETLNKISDERLAKLKANLDKTKEQEAVVNAVRESCGAPTLTLNAMPAFIKKKIEAKEEEEEDNKAKTKNAHKMEDEEEDEEMSTYKKTKNTRTKAKNTTGSDCDGEDNKDPECGKMFAELDENSKTKNKRATCNEWLASAPPEIRSAVRNAMEIEKHERVRLVNRLTANVQDGERLKSLSARLMAKPLDELRDLIALMPPTINREPEPVNYFGAAGGSVENQEANADKDDILPLPTINWSEEVAGQRKAAR